MEKIILKFSAEHSLFILPSTSVVLTMDENGKKYAIENDAMVSDLKAETTEKEPEKPKLPKRVMKAFTESAINKILAKDEIPNETGTMVFDGYSYTITITKGDLTKEYDADEANIVTYPLLRYLATWCSRKFKFHKFLNSPLSVHLSLY